jgi:putative FmdB family regulatory protein
MDEAADSGAAQGRADGGATTSGAPDAVSHLRRQPLHCGYLDTCRRFEPEGASGEGTMAVYELKCKDCGTAFEITCHMDERDAQAVCPKCGSHNVEQRFSAAFSSPPPAKY